MKRLCACGRLVEKGTLCVCQIADKRARIIEADKRRPSPAGRGYASEWRALRKVMLAEQPTCDRCPAPATEVHHIQSVRERPDLRLVPSNLMCLCRSCHSAITARTQAFGRALKRA